nr:uroplakin-3a isoform X2 [Jaculus jaculus]
MFDGSEPLSGAYEVYLYVMVDSASSRNASVQDSSGTPLSSTFRHTQGGKTGPYKAAAFDLTPCSDLPSLDAVGDVSQASEILNAYLVRVGNNGTCLWDPNFQGLCNPPLSAATEYRFKYVLVNMSTGLVQDQTLWSDPIRTNRPAPYAAIDTWPGRRSGCMIVITAILGSLPFFLLVAFAGAIVLSFVDMGSSDGETTHDSQITQEAVPKSLGTSETSYTSVNRGPPLDRAEVYSSKLQD